MYACARRRYTFAFLRGAGQAALRASRIRVAISSMPTMFLTCQYMCVKTVTRLALKDAGVMCVHVHVLICARASVVCANTCMSACAHVCLYLRVRVMRVCASV